MQLFYIFHITLGALCFLLVITALALPVYRTINTGLGGFETTLWQTCLNEKNLCKTIEESSLPCARVGHIIRTSRGFGILSIFAAVIQIILALLCYIKTIEPLSKLFFSMFACVTMLLVLVSWTTGISLYLLKQCDDGSVRRAAVDIHYLTMGAGPIVMITAFVLEFLGIFFGWITPDDDDSEENKARKKYVTLGDGGGEREKKEKEAKDDKKKKEEEEQEAKEKEEQEAKEKEEKEAREKEEKEKKEKEEEEKRKAATSPARKRTTSVKKKKKVKREKENEQDDAALLKKPSTVENEVEKIEVKPLTEKQKQEQEQQAAEKEKEEKEKEKQNEKETPGNENNNDNKNATAAASFVENKEPVSFSAATTTTATTSNILVNSNNNNDEEKNNINNNYINVNAEASSPLSPPAPPIRDSSSTSTDAPSSPSSSSKKKSDEL